MFGSLTNFEHSEFINRNIELFNKNRIGQYSKFLDKNPIFVTYYHINEVESRVDAGTFNIESELGPNSPIRFNKIKNLPMYNIPELKPDIQYDESGMDIDLTLSDVTILPKTVIPTSPDYVLIEIPGAPQYLFRVNNIKYNSIQSNDFYMVDMDIKDIGTDLEMVRQIDSQVVGEYYTVFDNIGTMDNCFVKTDDIPRLNAILDLSNTLKKWYLEAFYDARYNSIIIDHMYPSSDGCYTRKLYDPMLEVFMNKSRILYGGNTSKAYVFTPNDILDPTTFNKTFSKTLYSALLTKNTEFLSVYEYETFTPITSPTSLFTIYDEPTDTANVWVTKNEIQPRSIATCEDPGWTDISPISIGNTVCHVPVNTNIKEYISSTFLKGIVAGELDTDNYLELIIFDYLAGREVSVKRTLVIESLDDTSIECFRYVPMVIYILIMVYYQYFNINNVNAIDKFLH